jgi:hypothetical protein
MKQNNLIQALLLAFIIVVTAALAIPAYVPKTGANNMTGTYTTVKTYVDNSTVTWYEISYITITYTNTSTIVETFTSYKTVLKPTTVLQVEIREVADPEGRVSTIQVYVPKRVIVPITETYEVFLTRTSEVVEDTVIMSSKMVTGIEYSTYILVETFKPEIEESENNYLTLLMIAIAVGLVAAIALTRARRKRVHVKGVCGAS